MKDEKTFLRELYNLLGKYDAEITAKDEWTGYSECGEDIRMTVHFENWKMQDIDLGDCISKDRHWGKDQ